MYGKTEDAAWEKVRRMLDNADKGIPTTLLAFLSNCIFESGWITSVRTFIRVLTLDMNPTRGFT